MDAALELGIVSADGDRLSRFHRAAFGFEITAVLRFPEGTVWKLRRGNARCKVFQPDPAPTVSPTAPPAVPLGASAGLQYGALVVGPDPGEVDAVVERVRTLGGSVDAAPRDHRPGARFALVRDVDGNRWEILSEPDS